MKKDSGLKQRFPGVPSGVLRGGRPEEESGTERTVNPHGDTPVFIGQQTFLKLLFYLIFLCSQTETLNKKRKQKYNQT